MTRPGLGTSAWRTFVFETTLPGGSYTIFSRATDELGDVQPEHRGEDERGYGNNGWHERSLQLRTNAKFPTRAATAEPKPRQVLLRQAPSQKSVVLSADGVARKKLFLAPVAPKCGTCHSLADAVAAGMVGPHLDTLCPDLGRMEAAIHDGVGVMPSFKSSLKTNEIKLIARYVFEAIRP